MADVRVLATIRIEMKQEEGKAPYVEVSHPADDATCGMMLWAAAKSIGKNLEDRRVSIERSLPPNGARILHG